MNRAAAILDEEIARELSERYDDDALAALYRVRDRFVAEGIAAPRRLWPVVDDYRIGREEA